jgi:hypothetical protein
MSDPFRTAPTEDPIAAVARLRKDVDGLTKTVDHLHGEAIRDLHKIRHWTFRFVLVLGLLGGGLYLWAKTPPAPPPQPVTAEQIRACSESCGQRTPEVTAEECSCSTKMRD